VGAELEDVALDRGAVLATFAATKADGAAQALLVLIVFVLVCLAAEAALPRGDGLREWRQ